MLYLGQKFKVGKSIIKISKKWNLSVTFDTYLKSVDSVNITFGFGHNINFFENLTAKLHS